VQSLIDPGAEIAPGFGSVTVTLEDSSTVSGTYQGESADSIRVGGGSAGARSIAKSRIASRRFGPSSMPPMKSVLTRAQIRDVVAYLASLTGT
jgi:putative heme-binding domain-containing protein